MCWNSFERPFESRLIPPNCDFLDLNYFSIVFLSRHFFGIFSKTKITYFSAIFIKNHFFLQNLKLKIQFFEKIKHFWKIRKKKNVGREGESIVPLEASGEGGEVAPHGGRSGRARIVATGDRDIAVAQWFLAERCVALWQRQ